MWLSKRVFLLSSLAAFAACGFTPVYTPGGNANRLQDAVVVAAPKTQSDYFLVVRLEERLGHGALARFDLATTTTYDEQPMAVTSDGVTSRINLVGQTSYKLSNRHNGDIVTEGEVTSFTGFSASGSTVSSLAAKRDAQERLSIILADKIVNRLFAAVPDLP